MSYTLLNDGDTFEKVNWERFLKTGLPSYEAFWSKKIVPLTNRPINIHFKSSADLTLLGYTAEDVCIAQLHYTVLRHLARTFEILEKLKNTRQTVFDTDNLGEGLFHICGAQDVSFELLQRNQTPNTFDPWAPTKRLSSTSTPASKEAKDKWQKDNGYPLQEIRDYRNHLTHGRMSPSIQSSTKIFLPKITKENNYLDWRIITDGLTVATIPTEFDSLDNILQDAWNKTLTYLEKEWQKL